MKKLTFHSFVAFFCGWIIKFLEALQKYFRFAWLKSLCQKSATSYFNRVNPALWAFRKAKSDGESKYFGGIQLEEPWKRWKAGYQGHPPLEGGSGKGRRKYPAWMQYSFVANVIMNDVRDMIVFDVKWIFCWLEMRRIWILAGQSSLIPYKIFQEYSNIYSHCGWTSRRIKETRKLSQCLFRTIF